jgi:hypothetical protein
MHSTLYQCTHHSLDIAQNLRFLFGQLKSPLYHKEETKDQSLHRPAVEGRKPSVLGLTNAVN